MKRLAPLLLILVLGFAGSLGWFALGAISINATALAIGIGLGVLAGVPMGLMAVAVTGRRPDTKPERPAGAIQCTGCGQTYDATDPWWQHDCNAHVVILHGQ